MNSPAPAAPPKVPTAPLGTPVQLGTPVPSGTPAPPRPPQASATALASAAATAALTRASTLSASRPAPATAAKPETVPSPTPTQLAPPQTAAAASVHPWQKFFADWPSEIPTRGILISRLNEASPFKAFMLRGDFLLLERTSPDSLGGRFLVLPFEEISTVKFTDPLKQPALEAAGFRGQLAH